MTATLRQLSDSLKVWATEDPDLKTENFIDITSGGIQEVKRDSEPPALFLTQDDAIHHWIETCRDYCVKHMAPETRYKWVQAPVIDKWLMTATAGSGSHRVVSTRYTVYSRAMVSK